VHSVYGSRHGPCKKYCLCRGVCSSTRIKFSLKCQTQRINSNCEFETRNILPFVTNQNTVINIKDPRNHCHLNRRAAANPSLRSDFEQYRDLAYTYVAGHLSYNSGVLLAFRGSPNILGAADRIFVHHRASRKQSSRLCAALDSSSTT
jgi:hypothetical protein